MQSMIKFVLFVVFDGVMLYIVVCRVFTNVGSIFLLEPGITFFTEVHVYNRIRFFKSFSFFGGIVIQTWAGVFLVFLFIDNVFTVISYNNENHTCIGPITKHQVSTIKTTKKTKQCTILQLVLRDDQQRCRKKNCPHHLI